MTASGPRSLLCTNLVSAPCLPNSHPQGRRELPPPDLRVLSPLHTLTSPSTQTCGSPKNLLFAHSFTVHGSFRERGEMLTHAHTCTHTRTHTRAHVHTWIFGHCVAFFVRKQEMLLFCWSRTLKKQEELQLSTKRGPHSGGA